MKKFASLDAYVNRWWQTAILLVIAVIGIWSLYAIIAHLAGAIAKAI